MSYSISPPWLLRRYVAAEYLRWFLFCLIGFDSIALLVDFFSDKAPTFLKHSASIGAVLRCELYQLPEFIAFMIPASALIAMMIALSGLAKRNEITAILAGGIGRRTIVAPMALIALLACVLQFTLSEYIVPEANAQKNYVMDVEISGKAHAKFSDRRNHWFFMDGGFLRVGVIDRRAQDDPKLPPEVTLHDVTYLKPGAEGVAPVRIEANAAHWNAEKGRWLLVDARRAIEDSSGLLHVEREDGQALEVSLAPADLSEKVAKTEEWGVVDLQKIIRDRKRLGQNVIKETVDLHQRFAFPLAGFVMALLGAPFAFREHRRGGALQGIGMGIVLGFSYVLVMATALSFGKSGSIPPAFAAWLPVAVFGGTGIYLTSTLDFL